MFILYPPFQSVNCSAWLFDAIIKGGKCWWNFSSRTHTERQSIPDCFSLLRIKTRNISICFNIPRCTLRTEREEILINLLFGVLREWWGNSSVQFSFFSFHQNVVEWIFLLNQESCFSNECFQWLRWGGAFNVLPLPHFLPGWTQSIYFLFCIFFCATSGYFHLRGWWRDVLRWLRITRQRKYSAGISQRCFVICKFSHSSLLLLLLMVS